MEPTTTGPTTAQKKTKTKVRGTATFNDEDRSFEFTPYQEGDPVQKCVRKKGESRFYETDGEKKSSYVAHLKVDKDCQDPAAEMFAQLHDFTKTLIKKEPSPPKSKALMDKPRVKVWHRTKENKILVQMEISTDGGGELSSKLFNLTAEVNKCFAINRNSLLPVKQ